MAISEKFELKAWLYRLCMHRGCAGMLHNHIINKIRQPPINITRHNDHVLAVPFASVGGGGDWFSFLTSAFCLVLPGWSFLRSVQSFLSSLSCPVLANGGEEGASSFLTSPSASWDRFPKDRIRDITFIVVCTGLVKITNFYTILGKRRKLVCNKSDIIKQVYITSNEQKDFALECYEFVIF